MPEQKPIEYQCLVIEGMRQRMETEKPLLQRHIELVEKAQRQMEALNRQLRQHGLRLQGHPENTTDAKPKHD